MGRASRKRSEQRSARALSASTRQDANRYSLTWPVQQGLARLHELRDQQDALAREVEHLVVDLAGQGAGWGDIGRALRVTRHGDRQRYGG